MPYKVYPLIYEVDVKPTITETLETVAVPAHTLDEYTLEKLAVVGKEILQAFTVEKLAIVPVSVVIVANGAVKFTRTETFETVSVPTQTLDEYTLEKLTVDGKVILLAFIVEKLAVVPVRLVTLRLLIFTET